MTRGSVGGTVRYMAPELHNDDSKLTVPSDVYALAITLWEVCREQPISFG
jgi:serine/threonine protein kinase